MGVQRHINTRSPFYIQIASVQPRAELNLKIWNGDILTDKPTEVTYTLEKETVGGAATFEVAELIRDFNQHTESYATGHCWVETSLGDFTVGYINTLYHASEGYSLFTEGVQHNGQSWNSDFICLPQDPDGKYYLSHAEGWSGYFQAYVQPQDNLSWTYQYLDKDSNAIGPATVLTQNNQSSGQMVKFELGSGDRHFIQFDFDGELHLVEAYAFDCQKYSRIYVSPANSQSFDAPINLHYVNKFGARNTFAFSLKHMEKIETQSDQFMRNTTNYSSMNNGNGLHATRKRLTGSKQSFTINSDYIPEYFVSQLEELIMSEYVWAVIPHVGGTKLIPVNLKTKAIEKKNHLNDGLLQYTLEITTAAEYINTVR